MKITLVIESVDSALRLVPIVHSLRSLKVQARVVYLSREKDNSIPLFEALSVLQVSVEEYLVISLANTNPSVVFQTFERFSTVFDSDYFILSEQTETTFALAYYLFWKKIDFFYVAPEFSNFSNKFLTVIVNLAKLNFLPSFSMAKSFLQNGISKENLCLTGSTVVDSLHFMREKIENYQTPAEKALALSTIDSFSSKKLFPILFYPDSGMLLEQYISFCEKMISLSGEIQDAYLIILIPNNLIAQKELIIKKLDRDRIIVLPMLTFASQVYLFRSIRLFLTNSKSPPILPTVLKIPLLVLEKTEHYAEFIRSGHARALDITQEEIFIQECQRALSFGSIGHSFNPLGDGRASKRIAQRMCGKYFIPTQVKEAAVIPFPTKIPTK